MDGQHDAPADGEADRKIRTRTFKVSTPYDGTVAILPRQAGSAKVSVTLLADGTPVKTNSFRRAAGASLSSTVCGVRAYTVRVRLTGAVTKTTKTTVTLFCPDALAREA